MGRLIINNTSCLRTVSTTHLRKSRKLVIDRPYRLLDSLLERPADAHHLAHALHAAAQQPAHAAELLQVPPRDLHHHVVQARLKARRRHLRHRVLDLVQRDAQPELRRNERQRVPGCLGRQRGRAGQTGVDLMEWMVPDVTENCDGNGRR